MIHNHIFGSTLNGAMNPWQQTTPLLNQLRTSPKIVTVMPITFYEIKI